MVHVRKVTLLLLYPRLLGIRSILHHAVIVRYSNQPGLSQCNNQCWAFEVHGGEMFETSSYTCPTLFTSLTTTIPIYDMLDSQSG
jgi:hypothetical protein